MIVMSRRTSIKDASRVERADDLDEIVQDKRQQWRANNAKARRRQRRYKRVLTDALKHQYRDEEE
jgi:hypothetical protein